MRRSIGGSNTDKANGVAVDSSDNVYVVGETQSGTCGGCTAFPTTSGSFATSLNGASDAFVAKLTNSLGTLSYSTFLGGSNYDYGNAIAVRTISSVTYAFVTGHTQSTNFPTASAFDSAITGILQVDAFVAKVNPAGSGTSDLVYSTYLGGSGRDYGYGIAVNSSGEAFVTGKTQSTGSSVTGYTSSTTGFPYTAYAHQNSQQGAGDAFLTRLGSSGNSIVYSTFLGGGDIDTGYGISLSGNIAYITGETDSTDFPLNPSLIPFQGNQTGTDAFLSKIDSDTTSIAGALLFSTYHGGGSTDSGRGVAVSGSAAYLVGFTNSNSTVSSGTFPVSGSPFQDDLYGYGYDCFVAKITP